MTTGIKYALLLLPTAFDQEKNIRQLLPDMMSWRGKLSDLIDEIDLSQWKQWLGDLAWRDFEKESRFVFVSMPSDRAEVIDAETATLRNHLRIAATAMLLAAPNRPHSGVARGVHGEALSVSPCVRLKTIRGQFDLEEVKRPYYATRKAFSQHFVGAPSLLRDPYLDRWAELIPLLDKAWNAQTPKILQVAFQAFEVALTRSSLEFAIPEFVRCVECIVGLQQGKGGKHFADRVIRIARHLQNHWYVGGTDLQVRIELLYKHRSDCVHGKIPFETLLAGGIAGEDEAARLDYLAEAVARECLLWVLKNPQHLPHFVDRATLESAWATHALK